MGEKKQQRDLGLYDNMLDSLKMEQLNERISNLDGIYVMSVVNIIRIIMLLYH